MDFNRDFFLKFTVPKRWKGDLEDENVYHLKCTATLNDVTDI